ncbi:MAG: TetR/AcrR family transcriptional regulator [Bacteroidota bacterium]|nr:TetR/AcrR family transcriptional regulator [Bacteroidota bacterium]
MELSLQIKMNVKLFLRNPEETELGRAIILQSIVLIHKAGFESFTFKKLAEKIGTTEAGIYRYFENKHRLLIYIVSWYWSWLEYKVMVHTNNMNSPEIKLRKIIQILATQVKDDVQTKHVDERLLHEIVRMEGAKVYLTRHVTDDNKQQLFKPYKDLCGTIASIILECNPKYKFPRSLSSTIIEMAHYQNFFMRNLPSLTDFGNIKDDGKVIGFLEDLVFASLLAMKRK